MLDIPTAKAKAPTVLANRQTRLQQPAVESGFGLGAQPEGSTSVEPQTTAGPGMTSVPTTSTTPAANPWMSYDEFFAGDPEAQKYSIYHASPGYVEDPSRWPGGVDPYSYSNKYNEYREGLPLIYQDLINYGVSPESVASGQVHSIARSSTPGAPPEKIPTDPAEAMAIYGSTRGATVGAPGGPTSASGPIPYTASGSSHGLAPEVVNRMWR
jgi:hypothetical protein